MLLDPTLDELAGQDPSPAPPRGLPPPQPTPSWYNRGVEQQQRWGLPEAGGQLSDLASRAASGVRAGWNWADERARTAMTGDVDEESIKAATDLTSLFMGGGMAGAETGAAGVAGGRLFLKNIPSRATARGKDLQLIDESGKVIGNVNANLIDPKTLYVGWTGAAYGPWAAGTSEMLSFMSELQHEFPGIEKIKAMRVSGARHGGASAGTGGAREITIPRHRRITPGTPRDAPPEPGAMNPITEERKQQWQQRNPYEKRFASRTREQGTAPPPPPPPPHTSDPIWPPAEPAPPVSESWSAMRQRQNTQWNEMQNRQNTEWEDLLRRLSGGIL